MKNIILLLLIFVLSENSVAQNLLFMGSKSYTSAEPFTLKSSSDIGGQDLDISIAKNKDGGLIALSTQSFTGVLIKGQIIIYLDNGTVIKCLDRKLYDHVDDIATTIFYLTKDEIEKLKESNINAIRFSLKCGKGCTYSTEEGNYSVKNISKNIYSTERVDVPFLVQSLFEN